MLLNAEGGRNSRKGIEDCFNNSTETFKEILSGSLTLSVHNKSGNIKQFCRCNIVNYYYEVIYLNNAQVDS